MAKRTVKVAPLAEPIEIPPAKAYIWNYKIRPAVRGTNIVPLRNGVENSHSLGFLECPPLLYMYARNNNNSQSPQEITDIIDKYLLPFNMTMIMQMLTSGINDSVSVPAPDVPMVKLTYRLLDAMPTEVVRQVPLGEATVLQTPAALGFAIPQGVIFQAWTFNGEDVTTITPDGDVVIEGRVERLPQVIYTLDYAEPYEVRVFVSAGTTLVLPTPEELGFVLPPSHTFLSWTYLGQDITEITVNQDVIIEGRVKVPGENLILLSKTFGSGNPKTGGAYYLSTGVEGGTPTTDLGDGVRGLNIQRSINTTGTNIFNIRLGPNAASFPLSNRDQVLSFAYTQRSATPIRVQVRGFAVNALTAEAQTFNYRGYLDGNLVFTGDNVPGLSQTYVIPAISGQSGDTHMIEIYRSGAMNITTEKGFDWEISIRNVSGTSNYYGTLFLPKIEDVTGLPEEEQRATAWVPHVDDPVE